MTIAALFLFFSGFVLWTILSFGRCYQMHARMLLNAPAVRRQPQLTPEAVRPSAAAPQWAGAPDSAAVFGNSFTDAAADIIFVKNYEHRYQWINPAGAQLIGRSSAEIIGATDKDLFPRDTAARHLRDDEKIMQSGRAQIYEDEERIGRDRRRFLVHKMPWRNPDGEVVGVIGVAREITGANPSLLSDLGGVERHAVAN